MSASLRHPLAVCADCDVSIRLEDVLIAYDAADGPRAFADCPHCRHVYKVHLPS